MTIIPPVNPTIKADKKLTIIMAIWTTEEYAMITFISLKVKHAIPKIIPPNNLNIIKNLAILYTPVMAIMRIIPYPPNFNKTPAKIIEPETGASTWALGNHWCTKNIGNFTKNAATIIIIIPLFRFKDRKFIINIFNVEPDFRIKIIINSRGKEANNVYMRRKNLAFNRSIW